MKYLGFLKRQTVWLLLLALVAIGGVASPDFLTPVNVINILRQACALGFVSIGQTFAVIASAVDLSVGSIISLIQCVVAKTMNGETSGILPALGLTVLIVVAIGFLNGYFVAKRKGDPFIVTLGSMTALQGVVLLFTHEQPVGSVPNSFRFVADGYLGPIPVPVIVIAVLFIVAQIVLRKTRFGRYTLSSGGSEEVSRLSGISVSRIKIMTYILSAAGAAATGIFLAARMNIGEPLVGSSYSLDSVAAVVIGGTFVTGGAGSVIGTLGGVLLYSVLSNMMNILNIDTFYQTVIKGLIIIVAISIGQLRRRK